MGSGTHPDLECQQCPRGRRWDGSDRTGGQREADVEGCLEGLCDLSFGAEEAEGGRSGRTGERRASGRLGFLPCRVGVVTHKAEKGPVGSGVPKCSDQAQC